MNAPITITEVVGRAVQGMTRPFLCKAGFSDYYVKGTYAGLDSLCCEWGENIERSTSNIEVKSGQSWWAVFAMLRRAKARRNVWRILAAGRHEHGLRRDAAATFWNGCTWMATRVCLCNWT